MRLNHNMASLNIYKNYTKAQEKRSLAMERIESGYKVQRAKDNPTTIAQSEKMRIQIRGLQMADRNLQDGASMLQTAEGGLEGMTAMTQRIRELYVQGLNGVLSPEDKNVIQKEIDELVDGINDLTNTTEFNGVKLLGENGSLKHMVGANANETIEIPTFNLKVDSIPLVDAKADPSIAGVKLKDLKTGGDYALNGKKAPNALLVVDAALDSIVYARGKYGALENRFESTGQNVREISDRIELADSSLRDADIAEEMMNLARNNILIESATAIMVQTNKLPQNILEVLQNVKGR